MLALLYHCIVLYLKVGFDIVCRDMSSDTPYLTTLTSWISFGYSR